LKSAPKLRPISYAAHADFQIYSFYSTQLAEAYEVKLARLVLSECILAFRKLGKSNIEFACDAFNNVWDIGRCSVIAIDISAFFDTLNHQHLKRSWSELLGEEKLPSDHFAVFNSLTNIFFLQL